MPQSRKSQVSLLDTPYYHCVSRCVRRAFLCGEDIKTGQNYEHRRQWVEDKLILLPQVFAIDVCAYAIMHNHTHVVLHVDKRKAQMWDTKEILTRWHKIFKGTLLTQRYVKGLPVSENENQTILETAHVYRSRLTNISWFMRVLNESIARAANKEDNCTGRFWEGRFKSQALLDELALLTCMVYVDLNPMRAQIANSPEKSDHTSIKSRIEHIYNQTQPPHLMPLADHLSNNESNSLKFNVMDYLQIVEITGRMIVSPNSRNVKYNLTITLNSLNLSKDNWLEATCHFEQLFHGPVGREEKLTLFKKHLRRKRRTNVTACKRLFSITKRAS